MKQKFLLIAMMLILIGSTAMGQNDKQEFYEPLPFNGKNGNLKSMEETMWKVSSVDGKDTIINTKNTLYHSFDALGRVDSICHKMGGKPQYAAKFCYDSSPQITRCIIKQAVSDMSSRISEVDSEKITTWIDDKTQTEETKNIKTGELISQSTIRYNFEDKSSTTEGVFKVADFDKEFKTKSIHYYDYNRLLKSESYNEDNSLISSVKLEYNEADNSPSKTSNIMNAPLGSSQSDMTIDTECKVTKYDKYNNRVEWKEYRNGELEGIWKAKIVYR